jgi:large subunit ribosomal protein L18Ae
MLCVDQEMASRHRARFRSIQVIRVTEVKAADLRRAHMKQLVEPGLKFPLPHRVLRAPSRRFKSTFIAQRPSTFF